MYKLAQLSVCGFVLAGGLMLAGSAHAQTTGNLDFKGTVVGSCSITATEGKVVADGHTKIGTTTGSGTAAKITISATSSDFNVSLGAVTIVSEPVSSNSATLKTSLKNMVGFSSGSSTLAAALTHNSLKLKNPGRATADVDLVVDYGTSDLSVIRVGAYTFRTVVTCAPSP